MTTFKKVLSSVLMLTFLLVGVQKLNAQCEAEVGTLPVVTTTCITADMGDLLLNPYDGQTGATDFLWVVTDMDSIYVDPDATLQDTNGPTIVGFSEDGTFDFSQLGPGTYGFSGFAYSQAEVDAITANPLVGIATGGAITGGESLPEVYFALIETPLFQAGGLSIARIVYSFTVSLPALGLPQPCIAVSDGPAYTVMVVNDLSECPAPECAAAAGTITAPENTEAVLDGTSDAPTAEGYATEADGYVQVYLAFYEFVDNPNLPDGLYVVNSSLDGAFDWPSTDFITATYPIYALNYQGTIDDLITFFTDYPDYITLDVLNQVIADGTICADLVYAYDVNVVDACNVTAGEIATEDATSFCLNDDVDDFVNVTVTGNESASYTYVVTDTLLNIIMIQEDPSVSFAGLEENLYLVWGVAYDGDLTGAEVGGSALDITGCYDVTDPIVVEATICEPPACEANAGEISLANTTIPFGGSNDAPTVTGANEDYAYAFILTTDLPDNETTYDIVALGTEGVFSFEGLPAGTYYIHGISIAPADLAAAIEAVSNGTITSGEAAMAAITAGDICADLIVPGIELTVEPNVVECTVNAGTLSTQSDLSLCIGDVQSDVVNVAVEGNTEGTYVYVVTDVDGNILAISESNEISFNDMAAGTYAIWGLVHDGTLEGAEVGANAADLTGCFDLTDDAIMVVLEDCTPVCEANAGEISLANTVIPFGGSNDMPTVTGANETYAYAFILTTDLPGNETTYDIVGYNLDGVFSFEGMPAGTYYLHGLSIANEDVAAAIAALTGGDITSGEAALAAIADGVICADLIVPGIELTVEEEVITVDCTGFSITSAVLECTDAQEANGNYAVEVNWTGGEAPYTIQGTVEYEDYAQNTLVITDLADNTEYYVVVTDANGCEVSTTGIGHCAKCSAFSVTAVAECVEPANTAYDVTITIAGGTPPYSFTGDYVLSGYGQDVIFIPGFTSNTTYTIVVTDYNGCNQLVTGTLNCKLAVDLLRYNVTLENEDVLVSWATASEENSAYFIVERSLDGVNFSEVGRVNAAGDSHSVLAYAFVDETVNNCETYYYRLTEVDTFGEAVIIGNAQSIRTAHTNCMSVSIAPIPATSELNVTLNSGTSSDVSITIYDVLGRVLQQQNEVAVEGTNIYIVEVEDLAVGAYFVTVKSGASVETMKFVKK
ncbi:MAG: T9SS type A sorting domain-containing protein [Chitinophagales bacterium]|nr:T9SS type A sorting domain-containing protein [Bacteroidota bacterium]